MSPRTMFAHPCPPCNSNQPKGALESLNWSTTATLPVSDERWKFQRKFLHRHFTSSQCLRETGISLKMEVTELLKTFSAKSGQSFDIHPHIAVGAV